LSRSLPPGAYFWGARRGERTNSGSGSINRLSRVYFKSMTHSLPRLFYFNPLFDLELGGNPAGPVAASAKQMSPLFALMGTGRDRVILDVKVPGDYWDYLSDQGFDHARPAFETEDQSGYQGVPWGWNEQSLERLRSQGAQCSHPDLAAVKTVNGRAWCVAFNGRSGTGVHGSCFCASVEQLDKALARLSGAIPLVAKPAFGGSGHGFVRMRGTAGFSRDQRVQIQTMLKRGGCTLEPWLDRTADLSSSCMILPDGTVADTRHYRCHVTGHGAFYGVPLGISDLLIARFEGELAAAARKAATALASAGYFGPAHFDAIVYQDSGGREERCAPVIEVNARYGMSAIAYAIHEKIGPDRCVYMRFISRKKMRLPETYAGLQSMLGSDRYNPITRTGILVVSPLRVLYGSEKIQPSRTAFVCVEKEATELWNLDNCLRKRQGL
jgi:hypothetical protein